ncbi:hypothetical protein CR513_58233, partial [Mucuna pruriens]
MGPKEKSWEKLPFPSALALSRSTLPFMSWTFDPHIAASWADPRFTLNPTPAGYIEEDKEALKTSF